MTTATDSRRQPELTGQTVVIGDDAGIGLETARRARAEGAGMILTGRDPDRPEGTAAGLGALGGAVFDAAGQAALDRFPGGQPERSGRVMVTAAGPAVR